jgi:diaminopimelate epimerase
MRFTKMHGAGNDYVYVNCFEESLPVDPAELARRVSDRHFGIGGDGLILICPSQIADARMRMFNADGSESEMCGNGVRCVAKYVYDHGICRNETLKIETGRGQIPTTLPGNPAMPDRAVVNVDLNLTNPKVANRPMRVTCVSMGNPHCVTFVDELNDGWVLNVGPEVENDGHFPRRVNAEFVQVISAAEVRMRVWERGSGETLACGTGACAVCVAGALAGKTGRKISVHLPGGDLEIEWAANHHVYLTGEAVEVFSGIWPEPSATAP